MFHSTFIQILVLIKVFYDLLNYHEENSDISVIFLLSKTYKSKKNTIFLNVFCDIYNLFLFISFRAFLPSLRVLKVSQEREEMIRNISVIKEK